jgi:hypothetical protein
MGFSAGTSVAQSSMPPGAAGPNGSVSSPEGNPVPGAFITSHDPSTGIRVSVRTDADGQYRLPTAPPEQAVITAHFPGFSPAPASTENTDATFLLSQTGDTFTDAPSSAFLNTLPDGEDKRSFILDCTGCHQFNRIRTAALLNSQFSK